MTCSIVTVDRQFTAVVKANVVRGFMVHNGVLIQGAVWTKG